jgi:hypothetical protein
MAKNEGSATVLAIGVVAVMGFLALKLWPTIAKSLKSSGGNGGSGGAAGSAAGPGYYAPYNPAGSNSSGGGMSLGGQMGLPSLPGGSKTSAVKATTAFNSPKNFDYTKADYNADLTAGKAESKALAAENVALQGQETALGNDATAAGEKAHGDELDESMDGNTQTDTGFSDLPDWLNSLLGFDTNSQTTASDAGLGTGIISQEQIQQFDLSQVAQPDYASNNYANDDDGGDEGGYVGGLYGDDGDESTDNGSGADGQGGGGNSEY